MTEKNPEPTTQPDSAPAKDAGTAGPDTGTATEPVATSGAQPVFEIIAEENLPDSIKKFKLQIPATEFKKKLEEKLKELQASASIPGFRVGKAPLKLVEIQFGDAVRRETVEEMFKPTADALVAQKKLELAAPPVLKSYEIAPDSSVTIETEIEYIPALELADEDYKDIEIEIEPIKITEETINNYIEDLRWQNAMLEAKPGEPEFTENDALIADIEVKDEAGNFLNFYPKQGTLFRHPARELPTEVFNALLGKKRGQAVTVKVPNERKNEKGEIISHNDIYEVFIRDVKAVKLPALDDEFARDLGEFKSLAELREKIRADAEAQAQKLERNKIIEKIYDRIATRHKVELPKTLVLQHALQLVEMDSKLLRRRGLDLKLPADLEEQYFYSRTRDAARSVLAWLINRAISQREKIEVTEDDINAELEKVAQRENRKPLAIRASLERKKMFDKFVEEIKMNKVENTLISYVKIKYI
ncbi:MAG: trigger factor [Candidatus Sumerlaeia bacterium]|nr:trigger factor [Candidatus Sumerlaeia bacterium]